MKKNEYSSAQLFSWSASGEYNRLKLALESGISINVLDPDTTDSPLMVACRNGHTEIVRLCLQFGAKNDPHPEYGQTALHAAVTAGQLESAAVLLAVAAASAADGTICNLTDSNSQTPLHIASIMGFRDIIELLLGHGAKLSSVDHFGQTALHLCAGTCHNACLAMLLDHGGDELLETMDANGNTALHHAAYYGHLNCAKLLLETAANVWAKNFKGQTALDLAKSKDHRPICQLLSEYQALHAPPAPIQVSRPHSRSQDRGSSSPRDLYVSSLHTPYKQGGAETRDSPSFFTPSEGANRFSSNTASLRVSMEASEGALPRPHTLGSSSPMVGHGPTLSARSNSTRNSKGTGSPVFYNPQSLGGVPGAVHLPLPSPYTDHRPTSNEIAMMGASSFSGDDDDDDVRSPLTEEEGGALRRFSNNDLLAGTGYRVLSKGGNAGVPATPQSASSVQFHTPSGGLHHRISLSSDYAVGLADRVDYYGADGVPVYSKLSIHSARDGMTRAHHGRSHSEVLPLTKARDDNSLGPRQQNGHNGNRRDGADGGWMDEKPAAKRKEEKEPLPEQPMTPSRRGKEVSLHPEYYSSNYDDHVTETPQHVQHLLHLSPKSPSSAPLQGENEFADPLEVFDSCGISWHAYLAESGDVYYLDMVGGQSQWEDPRLYGIVVHQYDENGEYIAPVDEKATAGVGHIVAHFPLSPPPKSPSPKSLEKIRPIPSVDDDADAAKPVPAKLRWEDEGRVGSQRGNRLFQDDDDDIPLGIAKRRPASTDSERADDDELASPDHAKMNIRYKNSSVRSAAAEDTRFFASRSNAKEREDVLPLGEVVDSHVVELEDVEVSATDERVDAKVVSAPNPKTVKVAEFVKNFADKASKGSEPEKGPAVPVKKLSTDAFIKKKAAEADPAPRKMISLVEERHLTPPVRKNAGSQQQASVAAEEERSDYYLSFVIKQGYSMAQVEELMEQENESQAFRLHVLSLVDDYLMYKKDAVSSSNTTKENSPESADGMRTPESEGNGGSKAPAQEEKESLESLKLDSVLSKYAKMLGMGVPGGSVLAKMKMDAVPVQQRNRLMGAIGYPELESEEVSRSNSGNSLLEPGEKGKGLVRKGSGGSFQGVHWNPVPAEKLKNSIWGKNSNGSIGIAQAELAEAELEELEKLFAAQPGGLAKINRKSLKLVKDPEAMQLKLLERKRAQNITIGLVPFKSFGSHVEILKAICGLNTMENRLTPDHLENFRSLLPTDSEMKRIDDIRGSKHPAELFFQTTLMFYPELPRRLTCFITCLHFGDYCASALHKFKRMTDACNQVLSSTKLAKLFQKMLVVGNVMNQGTQRGDAAGFTLDSLLKMVNTKGVDKKTSVLDYVVKSLYDKGEERILSIIEDLFIMDEVCKLSSAEILVEYEKISKSMVYLEGEFDRNSQKSQDILTSPTAKGIISEFHQQLEVYLVGFRSKLQGLSREKDKFQRKTVQIMEYFGEDAANHCDLMKIFVTLQEFRRALAFSKEAVEWKLYRAQQKGAANVIE